MNNSDWIAIGGVVAALLAILWQSRQVRRQLILQNYSEYTRRYQQIILAFPEDINQKDFILQDRQGRDSVMRQMRTYFDLCYEEYFLWKCKRLSQNAQDGR